jgi:tetratricopeptide (TPR) repeat protein
VHALFRRAYRDYHHALDLTPDLPPAYGALLRMATVVSSGDDRAQLLRQALTMQPASYHVRYSYLWCLQPKWGGSWGAMFDFANTSAALRQDNPRLVRLPGYVHFFRGTQLTTRNPRSAIGQFGKALAYDRHWRFLKGRAIASLALGEHDNALRDIHEALAMRGEEASLHILKATVEQLQNRPQQALASIDTLLARQPDNIPALYTRAGILIALRHYTDALSVYDKAIRKDPGNAAGWRQRAALHLYHLDDARAATADLKHALSLDAYDAPAWLDYATALRRLGDANAIKAYENYLQLCRHRECDAAAVAGAREAYRKLLE